MLNEDELKIFYKDLGWHIKKLRQGQISQDALAQYIGKRYQQIQKYENGTIRTPAHVLWQISKLFKVPVGYFFGDEEQAELASYTESAIRAAREIADMPEDVQEALIRFMEVIKETYQDNEHDKAA
ncbi:MAG: helix-turn-helix transcriptional regulator [Pseudomonadota bacterium]